MLTRLLAAYGLRALLVLSVLLACWFYGARYLSSVEERGEVRERARWQAREFEQAGKYAERINQLMVQAREQERKGALSINRLGEEYETRLAAVEERRRNDVLSAATRRLRDPGAVAPCQPTSGGAASPVAATSPSSHGETGRELSPEADQFLRRLANDADQVAIQLAVAQDVILKYVEICNAR